MATLNFDEETLKADGGSLYDLYLALYNGSVAANKDIPSDSDFLVLDAEGNVDEDATSDKVSSYNTILMKNAAYSEANAAALVRLYSVSAFLASNSAAFFTSANNAFIAEILFAV